MKTIESLKRMRITSAVMSHGWISVKLNGKQLPKQRIKIRNHLYYVGDWSRSKHKVFVDDDVKDMSIRWLKFVAIHEVLEKHFTQNFVSLRMAHIIATKLEHEYIKKHFGTKEVDNYEQFIDYLYKAELKGRESRE